jgi:transposase
VSATTSPNSAAPRPRPHRHPSHPSGLPELRSFVTGLRRDQDAVTAALTLPYSSGAVEGHVNRKMLKLQMYGRASPDLLLLLLRILLAD